MKDTKITVIPYSKNMKIRLFVDSESAAKNIYKYPNINGVRISVNIKDKVIINSYKIIFIV